MIKDGGVHLDTVSTSVRSAVMRRVKSKNTAPELTVRRTLHALGLRFRLHSQLLPGSPDVVLPRHKVAVFVNGCFWHRHYGCSKSTMPATRVEYWAQKFQRNVQRDVLSEALLCQQGWRMLVIWECETKDKAQLEIKLRKFFLL